MPGNIKTINIKQVKTSRFIYYGLSTENVIGIRSPYRNSQCLSYFAYDGTVYANNKQFLGAPAIYDGSTITMVADLVNYKIKWLLK